MKRAALCLFLSVSLPLAADDAGAARIKADVGALASETYKGRRAGTPEADAAAAYVAESFRKAGLSPGGTMGSFLQPFDFVDGVDLGPKNALTTSETVVGRTWAQGTDFRPLAFSAAGKVSGSVVFAGYGISAKDLGWDDYEGLDVKGKVVLVLRYGPEGDDRESRFAPFTALRRKVATAKENGAAALLVVTGPLTKKVEDVLVPLRGDGSLSGGDLVAFSVKQPVAEDLFHGSGTTLAAAQKAVDERKKPAGHALKAHVELVADVAPHTAKTANVIGVLPGSDPSLNTEALVIGAHYDHLGNGGASSLAPGVTATHPGADDNASGVAAVLEIARLLAKERGTLKRSTLFIAFGAEEEGTLGSLHFTKHPTLQDDKIVAMLNLDMVGRLKGEDTLQVHGVGTSPAWKPLVEAANVEPKLKIKPKEQGYGPSDQTPFYAAGKPVLFFFTGMHTDYHRPSDTADRIDAAGEDRIVALVEHIAEGVLTADQRPKFTAVAGEAKPSPGVRTTLSASIGAMPDYSEESGNGLTLSGVMPGSPGEKAGLKRGDVVVRFDAKPIANVYDYTYALQAHKPGDRVTLVVKRTEDGATRELTLEVTLGTRPTGGPH
jgi:hypothetical protein